MSVALPFLDADAVFAACRPAAAVAALRAAMAAGIDLSRDPARQGMEAGNGQLLLMPSSLPSTGQGPPALGVKVITVAGPSVVRAAARIQGLYLMFDGESLSPSAILDGPALTTLRTPAVSVAAVLDRLAGDNRPLRVVVFGAGPQGVGHVECLRDALDGGWSEGGVRTGTGVEIVVGGAAGSGDVAGNGPGMVGGGGTAAGTAEAMNRVITDVRYLVRRPDAVTVPDLPGAQVGVLKSTGADAEAAVREADVVVCATTASQPIFPSGWVREDAVVIAVGSHSPEARELDAELLGRASVLVEDVPTALREAGDVVLAIAEGTLSQADLIPMADVVCGRPLPTDRPVVFKSVGMAWQDLVVAGAVLKGRRSAQPAG